MDAHPRCGIAGSRIYNYDGTIQESCGEFDTWLGAVLAFERVGRVAGPAPVRQRRGAARVGSTRRTRASISRSARRWLIRRTLFDEIGTFDERFFLYHEEVDFAKRAADAGWETWYVPASEAVHEGMGSARGHYSVEARKQASRRKYWLKHHGPLWYATLVAALVGRYVLYAALLGGGAAWLRGRLAKR